MDGNSVPEDWYQKSFGTLYPQIYAHRTVEAARGEAAFACYALGLERGDVVLDLCCGNGRHMSAMMRAGMRMIGLDQSIELLAAARRTTGESARLARGDMRGLPFPPVFDAVTNFFTSFGYFSDDAENARVLEQIASVLRPTGRFFIDHINKYNLEANLEPESTRRVRDFEIIERRRLDNDNRRINKQSTVYRAGTRLDDFFESVRLYTPEEFMTMLHDAGLEAEALYGDYDGSAMTDAQPRMIVVGRKR